MNVRDTYDYGCRYLKLIERDIKQALKGSTLRYHRYKYPGRKKKKQPTATMVARQIVTRHCSPKYLSGNVEQVALKEVQYEDFNAINTCPLDAPLMLWVLLRRFSGMCYSTATLAASEGAVLEEVVKLVLAKEHAKARRMWCKEILGLATFKVTYDSTCSEEGCPNRSSKETQSSAYFFMRGNARHINQGSFDMSVKKEHTPCSLPMQTQGSRKRMLSFNVDSGTLESLDVCSGMRAYSRMERKLQWVGDQMIVPDGFQPTQVWYLRSHDQLAGNETDISSSASATNGGGREAVQLRVKIPMKA
ncbi:hypothetical protein BCR41DRAFT_412193 [Lobosporangium transversale]|uniref:Uncharacterized protein n=1 Tax=Lobosporangium transversale TaxID=64571 RepID=A0A1Y2GDJ2_9FUNG|nr:hypothetical protein BCR41DRAFT_412193 [Lobosporangium transversale]ORZ07790.1 hypothetical protein BCR41DRAFT_412193 [Lobosporangium transversale]|eukprot:XP_021878156.1 hypothetical protein BCR41DRAFT_412193 [Lobosporangium transversale]